jgi:hypothetical protein
MEAAMAKLKPVKTPTPWTKRDGIIAEQCFELRGRYAELAPKLTLKLIGQFIGKTPGQMNRYHTESGYAPKYGPRKKKQTKRRSAKGTTSRKLSHRSPRHRIAR